MTLPVHDSPLTLYHGKPHTLSSGIVVEMWTVRLPAGEAQGFVVEYDPQRTGAWSLAFADGLMRALERWREKHKASLGWIAGPS